MAANAAKTGFELKDVLSVSIAGAALLLGIYNQVRQQLLERRLKRELLIRKRWPHFETKLRGEIEPVRWLLNEIERLTVVRPLDPPLLSFVGSRQNLEKLKDDSIVSQDKVFSRSVSEVLRLLDIVNQYNRMAEPVRQSGVLIDYAAMVFSVSTSTSAGTQDNLAISVHDNASRRHEVFDKYLGGRHEHSAINLAKSDEYWGDLQRLCEATKAAAMRTNEALVASRNEIELLGAKYREPGPESGTGAL